MPSMALVLCAVLSSDLSKILWQKAFLKVNFIQEIWLKRLLLTTTSSCKCVTASSSCPLQLHLKQPSPLGAKVVLAKHKDNTLFQGGNKSRPESMRKNQIDRNTFILCQNYAQNFSASNVALNRVNGWVNAPIVERGTPLKR